MPHNLSTVRQEQPRVHAALGLIMRSVRLIAATTPINAVSEHQRLAEAAARGVYLPPAFVYPAPAIAIGEIGGWLSDAAAAVKRAFPSATAALYLARIDELDLEAQIAGVAGKPALGPLAARRFGQVRDLARAERWASEPIDDDDDDRIVTDSNDPRSLLSLMRERVEQLSLDFEVVVHDGLSALAATGERRIYVAPGRRITQRVAQRTTLHETLAHAAPRKRARDLGVPLLTIGTAGGHDDQEGLALWLEHQHHFLSGSRKRELATRHLSVARMRQGADFTEVMRALVESGTPASEAVGLAARVFRGGTATSPGLGRESVYLPAFRRVTAALERDPALRDVLSSGQVSCAAAPSLARQLALIPEGTPWRERLRR